MKTHVSLTQRTLNVWSIVLICWSIYRARFGVTIDSSIDEFVVKPLIFLLPVYVYICFYEKKSFLASIDAKFKLVSSDILLILSVSALFLLTAAYGHWVRFESFHLVLSRLMNISFVLLHIVIAFAASISEEILSRGFVLKKIYEDSHNQVYSIVFTSLLFFLLHIPMLFTLQSVSGISLLQIMFTDFMLSIAVSLVYLQKQNIVLPIIIHALYNVGIYFFF